MKKLIKAILIAGIIIAIPIIYFQQSRDFYCLPEDKCVTVWKRIGGTCYVIPGKYYGVVKPSKSHIKTTNANDIVIYWNKEFTNKIIVRLEKDYEIENNTKETVQIEDFKSDYEGNLDHVLYNETSEKFSEVKKEVDYISVNIKEGYAKDKSGKKL